MALYVFFENKKTIFYFICVLLNLEMCQIILPEPCITWLSTPNIAGEYGS